MISLKMLERAFLPALSQLMTYGYWAHAIGLVIRPAKPAITNPIAMLSEHRNGTRDLDVSRAYIMSSRFNR
jgi:hypothetical protein